MTLPGTTATVRPSSRAKAALIRLPLGCAASTTSVMRASPAMIRFRAGKLQRNGSCARRQLRDHDPSLAHPLVEGAVTARIDEIRPAGENGDRETARIEAAAVGAGVDPEREPGHDGNAGRPEAAPEGVGDLGAVGGGPAGTDERDRGLCLHALERLEPGRGRTAPPEDRPAARSEDG